MHKFLLTVRERRFVKTPEELLQKHAAFIAGLRDRGSRVDVHIVTDPIEMYVTGGRCFIKCECGAGNSTEPTWRMSCCFECGAVYTNVIVPENFAAIEQQLVRRPQQNRYWLPGESLEKVMADNVAHGLRAD